MNIKLNEINSFKRELYVTVSWDDLENNYNEAFNKYMSDYTPKGGRKGKLNSFQKKKFKDQYELSIEASFKEDAMNEFYKKALEEKKIQPINKAEITKLEFVKGSSLEFIAIFEIVPSCKLPNYEKKYKINTIKYIASDKDVVMSLNELQEKYSTLEEINSKAESGFFINGDFQQLDELGSPIKGKNMKNQYIKLGTANFTGDCEKDFLGCKSGDVIKTNININGTETPYQITVNKVENQILPDLNDDFAKKVEPTIKSINDLKDKIKVNIQKSLDQEHQKLINNSIMDFFIKKTKLEAPISMIDNYMEYLVKDLKQKNNELNEEDVKKEYKDTAEKNVKWYLIKSELIKKNNITITNQDIDNKIDKLANDNDSQKKEIREFYKKDENLNNLYEQLLNDKLFNIIGQFAINKISEKSTSDFRKEK